MKQYTEGPWIIGTMVDNDLIKAAPEMYAALKFAQLAILEIVGTEYQTDLTLAAHYAIIKALIKAERGE